MKSAQVLHNSAIPFLIMLRNKFNTTHKQRIP
jgi:hypothetical protein